MRWDDAREKLERLPSRNLSCSVIPRFEEIDSVSCREDAGISGRFRR